jgi:hypothetical protein
MPCREGFDDLIEQSRWQEAIIIAIAAADFPDVIARPFELVALRDDDPGPFVVESEMALDCDGNLDGAGGIVGRNMRDREDDYDRGVIRGTFDGQYDHA